MRPLALNLLHPPQGVQFRLHILPLEPLPIVIHVNQLAANMIGPLRRQKQRQLQLLLRRNAAGDAYLLGLFDFPAPRSSLRLPAEFRRSCGCRRCREKCEFTCTLWSLTSTARPSAKRTTAAFDAAYAPKFGRVWPDPPPTTRMILPQRFSTIGWQHRAAGIDDADQVDFDSLIPRLGLGG